MDKVACSVDTADERHRQDTQSAVAFCQSRQEVVAIAVGLPEAQRRLAGLSIFEIVDALSAVADRWHDLTDRQRRETAACGLATETALLFSHLTQSHLKALLESELGDPAVLDDFQPRPAGGGFVRAFGPRCITHLFPGNVPDVAIVGLVSALLAKSASLARISRSDAALPLWFVGALRAVHPTLADACVLTTWAAEKSEITQAAFEMSDCAVVYGSDETISKVRPLIPIWVRALFHGHRVSFGAVARECCRKEVVHATVDDIVAHDQQGCLSPHLYYVESGGPCSPLDFAEALAQALGEVCRTPPTVSPADAARIWQLRGALPLSGGVVFQSAAGIDWTVLYDPDPRFCLSPLGRTIWIKPVADLADIAPHLQPVRPYLQAMGLAAPKERLPHLARYFSEAGIGRICPIGTMQRPPLTWHHDGRFRLLDLLRFVDWETPEG